MQQTDPASLVPAQKSWRRQFVLTRAEPLRSEFVRRLDVGTLGLYLYEGARAIEVVDGAGSPIGAFLGTPIDHEAKTLLRGPVTFAAPARASDLDGAIERFAYRFTGSWLLVIAAGGSERVYLDADGSLSLVYDPARGAAAATTGLLLDDDQYRARFDARLYSALGVAGEGWFPAGLTAHTGIRRLLCNHYLDCRSWTAKRHWPREDFRWTTDPREAGVRIGEIARNTVSALVADGSTAAALTGGNETRFLLAACRDLKDSIEYVTVAGPSTRRDVFLSDLLAEVADVRHVLLPIVRADERAQAEWRYRASHGITGSNMTNHPSIRPLARHSWFVGGLGGEIGRAFFWRSTDSETMALDGKDIVPRFGMPFDDAVAEATARWHESVRDFNPLTRLDLAYLELRMSAWAFAQEYADDTVPHIHPLIGREAFTLMLAQPPEAKRTNALLREGITAMWPELMRVPINSYRDMRDVVQIMRLASDPKRVAKKLRKMFG